MAASSICDGTPAAVCCGNGNASAAEAEAVARLGSPDPDARLKALREVKNQVIGNRTKKLAYIKLGAVPKVVDILATSDNSAMLVQVRALELHSRQARQLGSIFPGPLPDFSPVST
jgi:hypothetical protein